MNFLETHELAISTLSPVHIGCGEDYEPTNYVIDKSVLHAFDSKVIAQVGDAKLLQEIGQVQESTPDGTKQLRDIHKLMQKHSNALSALASVRVMLCKGVLQHYRKTQNEHNDFNRNGIERTTYNPIDLLPYLPGSSIKGAMRTAWLCMVGAGEILLDQSLLNDIQAFNAMIEEVEVPNGKSTWRLKEQYSKKEYDSARKDIEKELERAAGHLTRRWMGGEFELDPLRALRICDAMPSNSGLEREIRFCLNRSRSGRKSQAQSKNLYTRLEYILEQQPKAFRLSLSLQDLQAVAGRRDQKGKALAPESRHLLDWPRLVKACNDYYLARLDADLQTVRLLKPDSKWLADMTAVLDGGLREEIRNGTSLLLRVGKHGGADSNTVDGRQIKIMLNEDHRPIDDKRVEKIRLWRFDAQPRTTWFCGDDLDNPSDLMPHGWIVLHDGQSEWLTKLAGYRRQEERRQHELAAIRRKEEEEREAKERANQEAILAAMTPNQRRIEEFKADCAKRAEQLMGNKERLNATIHNAARMLAKAALEGADWSADEKRAVADAIEEWLPKLVRIEMKEERKKLKLAALRGQS